MMKMVKIGVKIYTGRQNWFVPGKDADNRSSTERSFVPYRQIPEETLQ